MSKTNGESLVIVELAQEAKISVVVKRNHANPVEIAVMFHPTHQWVLLVNGDALLSHASGKKYVIVRRARDLARQMRMQKQKAIVRVYRKDGTEQRRYRGVIRA